MNSSPAVTGSVAITAGMLSTVIVWLCSVVHIAAPPDAVASALAAMVLYGAHVVSVFVARRFPAPSAPPAPPAQP